MGVKEMKETIIIQKNVEIEYNNSNNITNNKLENNNKNDMNIIIDSNDINIIIYKLAETTLHKCFIFKSCLQRKDEGLFHKLQQS